MRVLDALCHNELLVAMGYSDEKERVPLTWFQRLTANILTRIFNLQIDLTIGVFCAETPLFNRERPIYKWWPF